MDEKEKPRLSRLTSIVTQLQSKRLVTAPYLAEKFGVSIRTVYRDIRTLENSGIPIITQEGKGYTIMEGYQLPPVMFTEEEANSLITAEQIILKNNDQSFAETYSNAITKIKSVLKYSQKEKVDLLAERIQFRESEQVAQSSNLLMTIQSAITGFQLINLTYHSLQGETTDRTVEPFAIYSTKGNWLLIAFCRLRKEFRAFRIDMIQKLIVQNQNFEPHKITLEEYFIECRKKSLGTPDTGLS